MKSTWPVTLLFLFSCATTRIDRQVEEKRTVMKSGVESLWRLTDERMESLQFKNPVLASSLKACHRRAFATGLKTLKDSYEEQKSDPAYWNAYVYCYLKKGDLLKAKFNLDLALAKEEKNPETLNNLALILYKNGHYQRAINQWIEISKLYPNLVSPKMNRIFAHLEFGHLKQAMLLIDQLPKVNDPDLIFARAVVELYHGNFEQSQRIFKTLSERDLKREDISTFYAFSLMKTGNLELAMKTLMTKNRTLIRLIKRLDYRMAKRLKDKMKAAKENERKLSSVQ